MCGTNKFKFKLDKVEKSLLDGLLLECQNDCGQKIKHCDYLKHLREECEVLKTKKVLLQYEGHKPQGRSYRPTRAYIQDVYDGDLQRLFSEYSWEYNKDCDKYFYPYEYHHGGGGGGGEEE